MRTGEIIWHDNLFFEDEIKDEKEKRPCVYLCSTEIGKRTMLCSAPITSQVNTFNNHSDSYWLLPIPIYSPKKLSFVNTSRFAFNDIKESHYTGISLDIENTKRLIEKMINNSTRIEDNQLCSYMLLKLSYILEICTAEIKLQSLREDLERKKFKKGKK